MKDYQRAAQIIKDSRFPEDAISEDVIALIIARYVDDLVEEIENDPEDFFKDNYRFWRQLDKAIIEAERKSIAA